MKTIAQTCAFAPGLRRAIRLAEVPALFSEGPEPEPPPVEEHRAKPITSRLFGKIWRPSHAR